MVDKQDIATFPSEVQLVTVDAVVLDGKGLPVCGLARDDFTVEEDGRPVEIASFEAFVLETPATLPLETASSPISLRKTGRAFAIILDDIGMTTSDATDVRRGASTFLESLGDGDEVSLGTTSGDAWWSARLLEGREDLLTVAARVKGRNVGQELPDSMSDFEAFTIHNSGAGGAVVQRVIARWTRANVCFERDPGCPGRVSARAAALDAARLARTRLTLQAVRRGLAALAPIRGRKSLLLFSRGFLRDSETGVRDVMEASREANAAVYFVDARGLVARPGQPSAADSGPAPDPGEVGAMSFEAAVLDSEGAQALADDTGGFSIRNMNDLGSGAARIADESRIFYLLGFYPPKGKPTEAWRTLRVEVKKPGLKVRARRGYSLSATDEPGGLGRNRRDKPNTGPDPAVAGALDSPHDVASVPVRAIAYVFEPLTAKTTHVVVAIELDASGLGSETKGASRVARLGVSVVATNRDSGRAFRHDDMLEFALGAPGAPGWRALAREFELPAGITQARVVVRDTASGAIGAVSQRFEVPPPHALYVSTPILTDHVAARRDGQARAQPALAAHRLFAPAGQLYCEFEVFGAARPPGKGLPQVAAGLELRAPDGRVVRRADPTLIAADPNGRVVRMLGIPLDGAEEGSYELVLRVLDESSGGSVERREAFSLRDSSLP